MQIPSFTLCVRFGVVCVVPITERELLPNGDPTDMTSVKFAPDSQQAQDWEQPMVGVSPEIRDHQQRIKQLFAGTSIEVDASRVSGQNEEMPRLQPYAPMTYRRPRRDVFGIFLSYNNYRVEQRGQKLIVLPRDQ